MNCNQVRDHLLAWQYGELPAGEQAEVQAHLAGCSACREELAAWQGFRRQLGAFKGPALQIDLPRIYQQAAQRHERRVRRWRRTALAVLGMAAALLIAVGLKLEIRADKSQIVLNWGGSPNAQLENPEDFRSLRDFGSLPPTGVQSQSPVLQVTAEDLQLVKDLIRALAKEVQTRDRQQQEALIRLQARFETLLDRANDRLVSNQRDLTALYTAYLGVQRKGEKP